MAESGGDPTSPVVGTGQVTPQPEPPYGTYVYLRPRRTNGMAIASLVLSIAAFVLCPVLAAAGIVLGYLARAQIRERDEDGESLALAGIITGWLAVGCTLTILVFLFLFTSLPFGLGLLSS